MSRIIVGVDGSIRGEDAIAFARRLADAAGATLVLAGVFRAPGFADRLAGDGHSADLHGETAEMLVQTRSRLGDRHVELQVVGDSSPARALQWRAERDDAALIVVGSTHRGRVGRTLPGSTADRLLHGAPCPVAIVPREYRLMDQEPIRIIGAGYDGSDESRAAVAAAAEVAGALGARLRVIRVFDVTQVGGAALLEVAAYVEIERDLKRIAEQDLQRLMAELGEDVGAQPAFRTGDAARELAVQSAHVDMLVLGSRGYGPLRAVLLGSVSHPVVREAACPVIVLPRGARDGIGELFRPAAEASA